MRIKLLLLLALIICCSESGKSQPDQRVKTQGRILSSERIAVDVNFLIDSIKGIITMRKEEPINLGLNYYNLAICYSNKGDTDSTLYFIRQVLGQTSEFNNLVYTDNDFDFLRNNPLWNNIVHTIDSAHLSANPDIKKPDLSIELFHIYLMDQHVRGLGLKNMKLVSSSVDSINIVKVVKIINQYGWPTFSMVGITSATGAFLVIQHSPIQIQLKYLPQLMEAAKQNEAKKEWLALLIDRISIRKNGVQIFGTQVFQVSDSVTGQLGKYSFFPIMDESKVDSLRMAFDMLPLKEYYAIFGIDYKPVNK